MAEDIEDIKKKLTSFDYLERVEGIREAWIALMPRLYEMFLSETGDPSQTDEILQSTFKNLHKRLLTQPLPFNSNIWAYISTIAENSRNAMKRKGRREVAFIDDSIEHHANRYQSTDADFEQLFAELSREELAKIILHIKNEWDRQLALLYWHLEHTPDQISVLCGWNKQDVRNGLRRTQRQLIQMGKDKEKYLSTKSPWEQELAFSNDRHAFGITITNLCPRNFERGSEKDLLDTLGLADLRRAHREFVFMLRIEDVNTQEPREYLTIVKRGDISNGASKRKPVHYVDYVSNFPRITGNGSWQNMIVLSKPFHYCAEFTGSYYDEQTNHVICEWLFPKISICIRKPLHEKVFVLDMFSPQIRQNDTGLFRIYPPDQVGKYRGIQCA